MLTSALEDHGILSRRAHPHLIHPIDHAVRVGRLIPLFPGTYAEHSSYQALLLALVDWDPDAVIVADCAAALTWWPDLEVNRVKAATRRKLIRHLDGVDVSKRTLHPDLVTRGGIFNIQHPAASTLDMAREVGPKAIDEALRRRAASPAALWWAHSLMLHRLGNPQLTRYLRDSRDNPWSHLEREGHALLRSAGITRWKANYKVRLHSGVVFLDVAFPGVKLGVEFDGWEFHGDRASFARDRSRDNALALKGWVVLRYTSESIEEMPPQLARMLRRLGR